MTVSKIAGEIVIQCEVAKGITMAWTDTLGRERTREELDEQSDLFMAVVGRQKAKLELGERSMALVLAKGQIEEAVQRKASLIAGYQASHNLKGRRTEFSMNEQQRKNVDQCDQVIEAMRKDIPLIEAQMKRLRALIAGEELPPEKLFLEAAE